MTVMNEKMFRRKIVLQNLVYNEVHQAVRSEIRDKLTHNRRQLSSPLSAPARFHIWGPDVQTESPLELAFNMTINDDMDLYLSVDVGVY